MKMLPRAHRRRRKGAAMVEFGICLTLLLWLMIAMFEGGRVYMVTMILNMACRVAARDAVANSNVSTAGIKAKIKEVCASGGLDPSSVTVDVIDASWLDDNPQATDEDFAQGMANAGELDMGSASPRQLGIFRAQVNFGDVALVTPKWVAADTVLSAQVVMRKE